MKTGIKTFSSINFFPIGMYARGCKGTLELENGHRVTVYGGLNDRGADGVTTFDVRITDDKGKPASIPGYRPYQRSVTGDDITCMLMQCQVYGRYPQRRKPFVRYNGSTSTKRRY